MPLIFTLHWWLLAFLVSSPPLQKFHVVLPTTLALELVALFLVELRWPAAYIHFSPVFLLLYIPNSGHDN